MFCRCWTIVSDVESRKKERRGVWWRCKAGVGDRSGAVDWLRRVLVVGFVCGKRKVCRVREGGSGD